MPPIVVLLLVLLGLVGYLAFSRSRKSAGSSAGSYVIGQAIADAREVESRRLERVDAPSPLGEHRYSHEKYSHCLLFVEQNSVDEAIRELLSRFAQGSVTDRRVLTSHLSMDNLYTLLHFGKRSAAFALREQNPERCLEGMMALAVVDPERLDPRDLSWSAAVVGAAASILGADREELCSKASALASVMPRERVSELCENGTGHTTMKSAGFWVAEGPLGLGLVSTDFQPYEPEADLLALAIEASAAIVSDRYPGRDFTVASAIPPVCFPSGHPDMGQVLDNVAGTVQLRLLEGLPHQYFIICFSEFANREDAEWFTQNAPYDKPGDIATIAFSAGRLVCVATERSTVVGVLSMESSASIRALLEPVVPILSRWAGE